MRYVHRDGRTGDFARAGLLFLFDIAFLTPTEEGGETLSSTPGADGSDPLQDARQALADYVLEGDFADVMAAGLGATFSVLPNKLRVPRLAEGREGGVESGAAEDSDYPSSSDEQVRAQLDLLLKLLGFVQDILHRTASPQIYADPSAHTVSSIQAVGTGVADATLQALQAAFVDNVLYPSILECSSLDGSAVAVLTYLDVMFSHLDDGPVLHRILDVLMDAEASVPLFASPRKARKAGTDVPSPTRPTYATEGRFTLRDLVLDNLKSGCPDSEAAALHLLQTLLGDHCGRVTRSLLAPIRQANATALARPSLPPKDADSWHGILPQPVNSTDAHLQEPELYSALVPRLDDAVQASIDTGSGFTQYLVDANIMLQADRCWQASHVPLQFISDDGKPALLKVGEYDAEPYQHALNPSDALVHALLDALAAWFTSAPDTNVALTGVLSALVRCPNRSMAGWLLYDTANTPAWPDNASLASDESLDEADPPQPASPTRNADLPALYQVLRELVRHVGRFRGSVPDFDRLLGERREGLVFAEQLDDAIVAALEPEPPAPVADTTPRKVSLGESIRNLWSPMKQPLFRSPRTGSDAASPAPHSPSPVLSPPPRTSSLNQSPSAKSPRRSLDRALPPLPETREPRQFPVEAVNVASGPWGERGDDSKPKTPSTASLTAVLDNCIVLDELVKELVAVITARRALGIDQVGYVTRQ